MTIIEERLALLDTLVLESGAHQPDSRYCVMEAVAYIAGESWSDHPECVSHVIAAFLRSWNDDLSNTDRQMLKPYITKVIGTKTTKADEAKRAWMATDWLVRECAPAFLRCAELTEHAEALERLAALTTTTRAKKAQPTIAAARAAARDAARAAAWDAAWATGAAVRAAAGAAAGVTGAAAWAAAGDAVRAAVAPTVAQLQVSAFGLLDRMIAVGNRAGVRA